MKEITIKIIYDNCKENHALQEGWGFSALIEADDRKILFDTGNDRNAFFSNMEKMGIDYREITDVVFSHKHGDHTAGCKEILEKLQESCRIYLPKGFPSKLVPQNLQIQTVSDFQEIEKNVYSMVLRAGIFLHEQVLILKMEKGLVIITGCAHPGIINILEAAQKRLKAPLYLVLGGFHLFRKNSRSIEEIVGQFQGLQVNKVAPCHCSGGTTIERFQETYHQDFYKIGTGSILTIS
ncbi:MAG TPA: MBL fold metallo-hydrolase [Rhabdochlamydiaceae bacterium]|nr:MBL fold metallo-hydrolase [Rhabdochlamydiaceae bacterium]